MNIYIELLFWMDLCPFWNLNFEPDLLQSFWPLPTNPHAEIQFLFYLLIFEQFILWLGIYIKKYISILKIRRRIEIPSLCIFLHLFDFSITSSWHIKRVKIIRKIKSLSSLVHRQWYELSLGPRLFFWSFQKTQKVRILVLANRLSTSHFPWRWKWSNPCFGSIHSYIPLKIIAQLTTWRIQIDVFLANNKENYNQPCALIYSDSTL